MLGSSEQAAPEEEETVENADDTVSALTLDSFYHGIQTGVTFVKFYAPWYYYCILYLLLFLPLFKNQVWPLQTFSLNLGRTWTKIPWNQWSKNNESWLHFRGK